VRISAFPSTNFEITFSIHFHKFEAVDLSINQLISSFVTFRNIFYMQSANLKKTWNYNIVPIVYSLRTLSLSNARCSYSIFHLFSRIFHIAIIYFVNLVVKEGGYWFAYFTFYYNFPIFISRLSMMTKFYVRLQIVLETN